MVAVRELPRLPTGKPDYQAVRDLARKAESASGRTSAKPKAGTADLVALYAELLGRPDATKDSSFVRLGGDSLSYVEMSVRLEQALGRLPASWHTTPIRDLAPRPRRFGIGAVETSVAQRALAILLIVGSHIGIFTVLGSAHVLLAVAGFNFARFQLTSAERRERIRHQVGSLLRIVVPSVAWIAGAFLLTDTYSLANVLLLNALVGPETWASTWHFWFIEVLVYILVLQIVLLAIPWIDRIERHYPFRFVLGLLAVGLVTRFGLVELGAPNTKPAFWLFALGWGAARATTVAQRLLLTAVTVASVPGFFDNPWREAVMIGGLVQST